MFTKNFYIVLLVVAAGIVNGQDILPPAMKWNGKSTSLIASPDDHWITPAEEGSFTRTPDYTTTLAWLENLCRQSPLMKMRTIGRTATGREIRMIVASTDTEFLNGSASQSSQPVLLIQAGIHAGEIDGKDAGMMLLRDIAFGKKKDLLNGVNILFVPILNVDGHERSSGYNRVNQRGPTNMGWRTNARNLNLNRDYTKLDTEELRAIVGVITRMKPDLYLDLHVTDGADYQYDITYGFSESYSPRIADWLRNKLTPRTDDALRAMGHIPGPLVFAANDVDFTEGMVELGFSARFSNGYGDLIHLPTILVENHSLKPYRQRVLGTYVFLEAVINVLKKEGGSLRDAVNADRLRRNNEVVLTWTRSPVTDTVQFLGIETRRKVSPVTGREYVEWTGKPVTQRIPYIHHNEPGKKTLRPSFFIVPSTYPEVIERLRIHGVRMELVKEPRVISTHFFKAGNYKFSTRPVEGRFTLTADVVPEKRSETFYPGSVIIPTDQPLGELVIYLLHPESPDSFFQWGFFPEIFTRTEYIEQYVSEPLAARMLASDPKLKAAFEEKKKSDPDFLNEPHRVYQWFYERSPYFDRNWLIYPVGMAMPDDGRP